MEAEECDHEVLLTFPLSEHEWKSYQNHYSQFQDNSQFVLTAVRTDFQRFKFLQEASYTRYKK